MKLKTREKIMLTARQMYNEHGYGQVSIAMLAAELGIAKGNLWYHFKDKRALLDAISSDYIEIDSQRQFIIPVEGEVLNNYLGFLDAIMFGIREYRFLFRDQADYGEHSETMLDQLPEIYNRALKQFSDFYRMMKKEGLLLISDDRIDDLSFNVTVALRYHLEFLRERGLAGHSGSGAVKHAFDQHLTLFDDKLSPSALQYLRVTFKAAA